MKIIFATFLACLFVAPAYTHQEDVVFVEYHHVEYVYKHDDVGLKRLTLKDIEDLL